MDVLTLTRSTLRGHSDMVIIMRRRCLHKTCCFSLIVIFILIFFEERGIYQVPAYKFNDIDEPLATEM